MTRQQKYPLRELTAQEQQYLEKVSRSQRESASRVVRAKALLAVAEGFNYTDAAHRVGRRSGDAVGKLVARFNAEGIEALNLRHGGGPSIVYGAEQRLKLLEAIQKQPDRQTDGTATWSLTTLQRSLRVGESALSKVSTYTLRKVLKEAGWSWQKNRSWCETGKVARKRKAGVVTVIDPDAEAKKH
ncbi:MAG TPA: helix-turn-helix domain-containing protein [Chroococcales cyanobacterium]|jgi:transposase